MGMELGMGNFRTLEFGKPVGSGCKIDLFKRHKWQLRLTLAPDEVGWNGASFLGWS